MVALSDGTRAVALSAGEHEVLMKQSIQIEPGDRGVWVNGTIVKSTDETLIGKRTIAFVWLALVGMSRTFGPQVCLQTATRKTRATGRDFFFTKEAETPAAPAAPAAPTTESHDGIVDGYKYPTATDERFGTVEAQPKLPSSRTVTAPFELTVEPLLTQSDLLVVRVRDSNGRVFAGLLPEISK